MRFRFQLLLFLPALFVFSHGVNSLPISTQGRWVVDAASGQRVKLRCVNWAAHMPATLAEGLDRKPVGDIAARVAALGFNCVRLTWATHLFTNPRYENLTVSGSLGSLGLTSAVIGIEKNNPSMVGITVREAYEVVVRAIGEAGLMAVLDNHVSRPQWCCGGDDGNGFFGDLYFDPDEWLRGLKSVATRFKGIPQVVGMSMRNELRGPNQSVEAWYHHITRGARTIHKANPDVLVIVSGLNYDTDLSFLAARPLPENYGGKLVLEAHWYAFSEGRGHDWEDQSPTGVCSGVVERFDQRAGFVSRDGNGGGGRSTPLFVSEYGVDQRGVNRADNRYLSCFLAYAAERDLDWAMWALQGSYYWRNGQAGFEETYGVLDSDWDLPKNPKFQERFRLVQDILQDPGSQVPAYQVIYHPLSGLCVSSSKDNDISLGDCSDRSRWSYGGNGTAILLNGTSLCMRAVGDGLPVILSAECSDEQSVWQVASAAGFQIAGLDERGRYLCLTANASISSAILIKECLCLEGSVCSENPQTQWFRFISSNVA